MLSYNGVIFDCLIDLVVSIKVEIKDTLFELIPAEESGIDFINTITNERDLNIFLYRNFYNGGGVGIGDINNDGLADIYMTSNQG
jgi:hypothetical protein